MLKYNLPATIGKPPGALKMLIQRFFKSFT